MTPASSPRLPSLSMSLVPIVVLVLLLAADVLAFGEDSSYGSNQLALLVASAVTVALGMTQAKTWATFESHIKETLGDAVAELDLGTVGAVEAGSVVLTGSSALRLSPTND